MTTETPICPLCLRPIPPGVAQSLHHLIPKLKGVTYVQLAELIDHKKVNIRNKLARRKFTAAFLLQSLAAIGAGEIRF